MIFIMVAPGQAVLMQNTFHLLDFLKLPTEDWPGAGALLLSCCAGLPPRSCSLRHTRKNAANLPEWEKQRHTWPGRAGWPQDWALQVLLQGLGSAAGPVSAGRNSQGNSLVLAVHP